MDRKVHRWASALFVISTLFLARYFASAAGEGSALNGTGALLLGGAAFLGIGMWETRDLSESQVAQEERAGFVTHQAFLTWLAWIGVVIGVGHLTVGWFELSLGPASSLPLVLGNVWFALIGILFIWKSRGAPSAQALETQQPRGITLAAQTAAGEGLLEAELGPGTPSHIGVEEAWRDRTDIGSHPEVYAFASVPHEMAAGEQIHTGESEARPVEFRTPIWPVLFEEVTDEEEDHVGLDAEDALQSAKLTGALKGRPRTFHHWLNGGRLVAALQQDLDANEVKDRTEYPLKEIEAGGNGARPDTSSDNQEPPTIRALLGPVRELSQAVQ